MLRCTLPVLPATGYTTAACVLQRNAPFSHRNLAARLFVAAVAGLGARIFPSGPMANPTALRCQTSGRVLEKSRASFSASGLSARRRRTASPKLWRSIVIASRTDAATASASVWNSSVVRRSRMKRCSSALRSASQPRTTAGRRTMSRNIQTLFFMEPKVCRSRTVSVSLPYPICKRIRYCSSGRFTRLRRIRRGGTSRTAPSAVAPLGFFSAPRCASRRRCGGSRWLALGPDARRRVAREPHHPRA